MLKFTATRLLVPILGATALAGAAVASPATPASEAAPTSEPVASVQESTPLVETSATGDREQETTPILCGGYDAEGNVVDPRAAETTEVPVNADGSYDVPDFCRGYTADGTFVGDD